MLTKIEDYRGYFSLAKNKHRDEDIQAYIDRFEVECLRELLQCEYDSFIADLVDGLPQTPKWLDIYNPFYECLHCEDISSRGLLDMIKCFVFYRYSLESHVMNTISGNVRTKSSSSTDLWSQFSRDSIIYNQYVDTFNAIMKKMKNSDEEYDLRYKQLTIKTPFD